MAVIQATGRASSRLKAERISAPLLVEDAVAEEILEIVLQRRQEGLRLLASGGR